MAIKPSDIEKIIKIKFPNANVTIEAHGVEPESPTIERYSINFVHKYLYSNKKMNII